MAFVTRFAPSPTGPLHLGHAYSALTAFDRAKAQGGTFLLRIENTDISRYRPAYEAAIYEDIEWLGITWPKPVLRQSDHLPRYAESLRRLTQMGLTYACRCTRSDILSALSAPQEGVTHLPPDGLVYPGTCRNLRLPIENHPAIRLDLATALQRLGATLPIYAESGPDMQGTHQIDPEHMLRNIGDIVLSRRDINTASYHLAVVIDDALQGVTEVTRGMDLFEATPIHVILQRLLGLPTPIYHHHRLIRDAHGKRLAKRDDGRALSKYRAEGATPADIRRMVGLLP
jgi:glutamyl-Q tRNA(Asp) synthetase